MSNEAINWALTRPIKHSSAKFVLVVLANCADSEWNAWPSVAHMADATGQDRKTVLENLKRLAALGFISDTGSRKGTTKQVPIYRLNDPENGTVEQYQKRDSTESGTVPEFPTNSTEIPHKQSRFSLVTVPKTGHGTLKNQQRTHKEPKKAGLNVTVPEWLDLEAWESWITYRKSIKAALSPKAASLCIAKLELLRSEGSDPVAVIDQSIMSGKWTGLFAVKTDVKQAPSAPAEKGWI